MSMNIQFKKGVLELCVLVLLSKRDYYGYELISRISERIEIAEGTVYPLLRRLTKEGFFRTYLQESAEGPVRKYYAITDKGRQYGNVLRDEWSRFVESVNGLVLQEDIA